MSLSLVKNLSSTGNEISDKLQVSWRTLYSEANLLKASLKLYTKSLFRWPLALNFSHDEKTLYDFARYGPQKLEALHHKLENKNFEFRPGLAQHYNFNGKHRTIYLYPWEERIVDTLLYHQLSQKFHPYFSSHSYAYRSKKFTLDLCQKNIAKTLRLEDLSGLFVIKRDIRNYFSSINHDILLQKLQNFIDPQDYLFEIIQQRIQFLFYDNQQVHQAHQGIPFGCAVACFLANLYLDEVDKSIAPLANRGYFRYADDILIVTDNRDTAHQIIKSLEDHREQLKLKFKPAQTKNFWFSLLPSPADEFETIAHLKHLGIEYRAQGPQGLSKDKLRKLRNIFRYALNRRQKSLNRIKNPELRAKKIISILEQVLEKGIRHIALIDYYLKHTQDDHQLKQLDLWLAEEVLSRTFGGGHKKGYFKKISFGQLRRWGLPSLRHRQKLIQHGKIDSSFFIWKQYQLKKTRPWTQGRRPGR